MLTNVTKLYPPGAAKNPDAVLEQAVGEYNEVLIIGWDKQDNLDIRANTTLKKAELLWLVDLFKHKLLAGDFDGKDN